MWCTNIQKMEVIILVIFDINRKYVKPNFHYACTRSKFFIFALINSSNICIYKWLFIFLIISLTYVIDLVLVEKNLKNLKELENQLKFVNFNKIWLNNEKCHWKTKMIKNI